MIPIYEDNNLVEMARLRSKFNNYVVCVYGDEGSIPHFHMCYPNPKPAEKVVCIRFDKPEYFSHGWKTGTLNRSEKKELMTYLAKPNDSNPNRTNWQQLIVNWNDENVDNESAVQLDENLPMPDYTRL